MRKRALSAAMALATVFGINSGPCLAQEQSDAANVQLSQNEQADRKDLLLFYEEKDLVTATKRSTTLRKAPAIATIIDSYEIKQMGARNLLDVLKMVPGFGVSINEYNAMMVEVRGIRSNVSERILVMIDGHSMNRNINGSALYRTVSHFPLENVKQIEIIRGPSSALYGNSAFVATINIITRNAEEINGVEIKGSGGSFNSWKESVVGGAAIGDKLTLSGSIDHYRSTGAKRTVEADTLTGTPFSLAPANTDLFLEQSDAFLKLGYGDLSFRSHYHTRKQGMNIGVAAALTDEDNRTQVDNYWGELAYVTHISNALSATTKFSYDYYAQDPTMKIYPNGFKGTFPDGMIGKPLVKDQTLAAELQLDWDITKDNHLISGVAYEGMNQFGVSQQANFNPATGAALGSIQEVVNWNKNATRDIIALYAQDEWQLAQQLNLTAGVRYDHYSDFGDTVNPRLGLVWSFLDTADLKLLYGEAFRAPNFVELYNANNLAAIGGTDLKPEHITTYEAGLSWRQSRYFAGNINYFYSAITDQIVQSGSPAVYSNINKSTTKGVEIVVNGALSRELFWKASYTNQDPRDDKTGERLPFVPTQRATGSLTFEPIKYLALHTDILWTGSRTHAWGDNRDDVPAYTTVDLAATIKQLIPALEIQATVHNLFDKRFTDPDTSTGNVNAAKNAPKVPYDFPREGLAAMLSAMYKF